MRYELNASQREALSDFFNNLAVAWFIAIFIDPKGDLLTLLAHGVSMVAALGFALAFRRKER